MTQGLVLFFLLFTVLPAQARKMSLAEVGTSAFFRFTAGMQNTGASFYDQSSGAETRFSDEVPYNYSGELGFNYALSKSLSVSIGAEFIQTQDTKAMGKEAASGAEVMTVNSSAFAFNPNLVFESTLSNTGYSKVFLYAGAGYANLRVTNDYKSITGTYAGVADYKEAVQGMGVFTNLGVAYQIMTVDNVSTVFQLGYRELNIKELEYSQDVTNILGNQTKGGSAKANDGSDRRAKIAGPYVGVTFRFHFPQFN